MERMLPGGISQSFAYDNIGRLVDSKTRQSTKVRRERRHHWGKADRLLKTEDSRYGTTSYEYSPTGHLQKATYADGTEEYRLSDKVGNLFDDPDRKLRKYLQGGKIEESGEWRFKYDKDGQLIEKYKGSGKWWDSKRERWQYEWNQNGTLKAVKSPHRKRPVQFTYDALGRRICKFASEYTHWVWNGNVPLHEWNTGQTWKDGGWQHYELDLRTWVFEEESFVPMALLLNGKAYSIVTDQLGTPTEAYNAEGEEVWRRRLDMNGRILEEVYDRNVPYSDRIRIPFLFQGQYYDYETGLAYNRFRYYDPELGRYISEDPIRFASGTLALHSYVEDSNDCIDFYGLKIYRRKNGQFGKKPGRKSRKDRKRELEQRRRKGVMLAWEDERKLVQRRNKGSREWSDAEIDELLATGRVNGYVGHHINANRGNPTAKISA